MKNDIHLNNVFFPWVVYEINNIKCWLKGNLFFDNNLIFGPEIISLFSCLKNPSGNHENILKDILLKCNGSFALVIETPTSILCVVDRLRSIPLFYTKNDAGFIISDDANYIRARIIPIFNEINGTEFLVTGYVTGSETLLEGVFQIQAGECLYYIKSYEEYSAYRYFQYLHGNYFNESEEQLIKRLDDVMVRVFNRLIDTTVKQGKTIVVPLSGGLDSRLIVAMLKRLGVTEVICFSYGKKGNALMIEAEISKHVAEKLGYKWLFVDYTTDEWQSCFCSEEMNQYLSYAGNLTSLPHIQDFLAIQKLKREGKIPENSVFVPGHSGDFLAGSYIPKDYNPSHNYSVQNLLNETLKNHYCFWNVYKNSEAYCRFNQKILTATQGIAPNDCESYVNSVDFFVFNEKVAKFVINSVRAYEFFGYQWRIPFWDAELIDFFLRMPTNYRMSERLYVRYAFNLFLKYFKNLLLINCTTPLTKLDFFSLQFRYLLTKLIYKQGRLTPFLPSESFSCNLKNDECSKLLPLCKNFDINKKKYFAYMDNYLALFYIKNMNIMPKVNPPQDEFQKE